MVAVIFLLGSALLGVGLMKRFLGSRLNYFEHWFFGLSFGWALATALAFCVVRIAGHLSWRPLLIAMTAIWLSSIYLWFPVLRHGVRLSIRDLRIREYFYLIGLLCLLLPVYLVLFQTHMLWKAPDGALYSGGESATYDIAFHAAITTSFLYGENFPPVYTAMPPAPLLYPPLPDFLTAVLVSLGLDLQTALVLTGTVLALVLTGIFYLFATRLLGLTQGGTGALPAAYVPGTALLATVLFLLNGGLGFLYFFRDWWSPGKTSAASWPLTINYANMGDKGIIWANIITDTLVAQRTSLFGLSLGLVVLTLFVQAWRHNGELEETNWTRWRLLFAAGVIAGLLPGFHPHSYVAVGIISAFLFILRPRRVWIAFWAPALLLAVPYLPSLISHATGSGFLRFQPGWRGQWQSDWPIFWVRNVGLPTLLIFPAWFIASRSLRIFYLAFAGLLLLSLLIVFSPNDYDNLKLMYYWYAATAVLVASWLICLATRHWLLALLSGLFVIASTASGVLSLLYEIQSRRLVFDRNEVTVAEFVRTQTAPRSLFLTAPSLHQPILSLAGRAIVRGPTAWLWSHGYPFAEREADVRAIYAGREDTVDLLRYYRVDYVYLGPRERQDLKANQEFFARTFPVLYHEGDIAVYDARPRHSTDSNRPLIPYPVREYASRVGRDPFQPLIAFREIGYPLYRHLTATLGRRPHYQEFMEHLRTIGRGVYPGEPGWRDVLQANQLPRFTDNQTAHDYNAAYVLMHYFGYLKRDIETDLEGYNFWLRELNRTGDYRGLTRAFIESQEYKEQTP